MMAVYVTGDCHRDFQKLNMASFPEQKSMGRDDTIIICGDFGCVMAKDEKAKGNCGWKEDQNKLNWLGNKSFTTVFCDGNHENFDRLYQYPVARWNGGKVHVIRPHVLHLMRGQVYTLEGEKIFVFGGASSHDIGHGILDPDTDIAWKNKKRWMDRNNISDYRIKGLEWWPQESFHFMDPAEVEEQKQEAYRNLEACGWKVRYIISHELPASVLEKYAVIAAADPAMKDRAFDQPDEHSCFLEEIHSRTEYTAWFAGHYHDDRQITSKDAVLYEQILRIL